MNRSSQHGRKPINVSLRFYAELNDFLPKEKRQKEIFRRYSQPIRLKRLIENHRVPMKSVELILVNGRSKGLAYVPKDGDSISVFPVFESLDISPCLKVRRLPLRHTKFVLDVHLGGLARYLRLLGFDCLYRDDFSDEQLVRISLMRRRILLSRDRRLIIRKELTHAQCIRSSRVKDQVREVLHRLDLKGAIKPFSRCLLCNTKVGTVRKRVVQNIVPRGVLERRNHFWKCPRCKRVYWQGSHFERMQKTIDELLSHDSK